LVKAAALNDYPTRLDYNSPRMKSTPFLSLLIFMVLFSACNQTSKEAGVEAVSGYIENKGSDTIVNLALAWAERYQTIKPDVRISVTGGGSGTGIASLINGTVDLANASRAIKPEEIEQAGKAGINPKETIVARDAIAVIVNPENPVDRLTMEQISRIFKGQITNWREVGGEDRPIVRLSRETNSGTHVYFLETVVRLGNSEDKAIFSDDTLLLPSSEGIIAEVRDNPNAIGYDGLGYVVPEVKILAIAMNESGPYILPSIQTVNTKEYPISRDLYIYSRGEPAGFVKEYLDWILSAEAQEIVSDLGFVPYAGGE
jgi:phosphate transport system substrate-binding protein